MTWLTMPDTPTKDITAHKYSAEQMNNSKQLRMRTSEDMINEEYAYFHQPMSKDLEDHRAVNYFSVKGHLKNWDLQRTSTYLRARRNRAISSSTSFWLSS